MATINTNKPIVMDFRIADLTPEDLNEAIAAHREAAIKEAGHWLPPYRSIDASGSPESAGQVGHAWLVGIARQMFIDGERDLMIDDPRFGSNGGAQLVYRGTQPVAATFTVRDPMNYTYLFRWQARPATSAKGQADE